MKTFIFILIFILSILFNLTAQQSNNKEIESLNLRKVKLESEIAKKQDSLKLINQRIERLLSQSSNSQVKAIIGLTYKAIVINPGKIRKEGNPNSDILTLVNPNDTVLLTGYNDGYWVVNRGQYFGYINEMYIRGEPGLDKFKSSMLFRNEVLKNRALDEERDKQLAEYKKKQAQKRVYLINKYGKHKGERLLARSFWIGMTDEEAIDSLGPPENINSTVGTWGRNEQWIYERLYLYFDNGIMTSYQTFR
jgi:hypothetical protein